MYGFCAHLWSLTWSSIYIWRKVGLIGEGRRFYNPNSGHAKWVSGNLPVGSAMTWYKVCFSILNSTSCQRNASWSADINLIVFKKWLIVFKNCIFFQTTFQAPSGTEPVVVDLQGMGKGHAWVNGNSLGRFWPTLTADPNGCDGKCDYRGQYKENKCLSNCGNPTQRWYCKFYQ